MNYNMIIQKGKKKKQYAKQKYRHWRLSIELEFNFGMFHFIDYQPLQNTYHLCCFCHNKNCNLQKDDAIKDCILFDILQKD